MREGENELHQALVAYALTGPFWQHYFQALFYGVDCTALVIVPVPLVPNDAKCLWNFATWLTDGDYPEDNIIQTKDFVLLQKGKRMHGIIYHVNQHTASHIHPQNPLLSDGARSWVGNVLVVWANNEWLPHLRPEWKGLLKVLHFSKSTSCATHTVAVNLQLFHFDIVWHACTWVLGFAEIIIIGGRSLCCAKLDKNQNS